MRRSDRISSGHGGGVQAEGMGRPGFCLCDGGRLCGPSLLRRGDYFKSAGGGGLPRGDPRPAGLSVGGGFQALRASPSRLSRYRREYRSHGCPLYGFREAAELRLLQSRRKNRTPPRQGDHCLLQPHPGSLRRRARSSSEAWRRRSGDLPITIIGTKRSAVRFWWIQGRIC